MNEDNKKQLFTTNYKKLQLSFKYFEKSFFDFQVIVKSIKDPNNRYKSNSSNKGLTCSCLDVVWLRAHI